MKFIFLLLLCAGTLFANAQDETSKIDSAFKLSQFIYNNKVADVIKKYGTDYETKVRTSISNLSTLITPSEINDICHRSQRTWILGKAIVVITRLYGCLVYKENEINPAVSNTAIQNDLSLMNDFIKKAFEIEKKFFDCNHAFLLSYSIEKDHSSYYPLYKSLSIFHHYLYYYSGAESPLYKEAISTYLEHLVALKECNRKGDDCTYNTDYTSLTDIYPINYAIYNEIDAQKFNKKYKIELKDIFLRKLPDFSSSFLEDPKPATTSELTEFYKLLSFRKKIEAEKWKMGNENEMWFPSYIGNLNKVRQKFSNKMHTGDKSDIENINWFNNSIYESYNYYVDIYDKITAQKTYCKYLHNPWNIENVYDPQYTLANNGYDIGFIKKYLSSLLGTIRLAASNNKKWIDRNNSTDAYYNKLNIILNALLGYYKKQNDQVNIDKVNNCLKINREEAFNSGELREALEAL